MGTRKQCRKRLVTLFDANSTFNQVIGYAPNDLNGATKVLCVYTDNSREDMISEDMNNDFHTFLVDSYVARENGEDSEDDLDDMHDAVRAVVRANVSDSQGNWSHLNLNSESDAGFAEISGLPYRVEHHVLIVKVTRS